MCQTDYPDYQADYSDYQMDIGFDLMEEERGRAEYAQEELLMQINPQEYDRQRLIESLQQVIKNDSHSYLKLKAEEFLEVMKLTIEMETH